MRFLFCLLFSMFGFCSWMHECVEKELAPFREKGILRSDIEKTWNHLQYPMVDYHMLRVRIKDNQVSLNYNPFTLEFIYGRYEIYRDFFENLCKKRKLPDVEFILNLGDAMDLGINFIAKESRPPCVYPIPIFVQAKKTTTPNLILFPKFETLGLKEDYWNVLKENANFLWEQKKEILFWRGATTGVMRDKENKFVRYSKTTWHLFPRVWLVELSQKYPDLIDASFVYICQCEGEDFFDFFTKKFPIVPHVPLRDQLHYKYLIEVDGNTTTYRDHQYLFANSLYFKQMTRETEWFYFAMKPYEHFIPVKEDFSDLLEQIQWAKDHDAEAKQIADNATQLAIDILSEDAVEEFVVLLLSEYALLLKDM